jgi:hypothetical protein
MENLVSHLAEADEMRSYNGRPLLYPNDHAHPFTNSARGG